MPQGVTLPAHGVHKPPQSDLCRTACSRTALGFIEPLQLGSLAPLGFQDLTATFGESVFSHLYNKQIYCMSSSVSETCSMPDKVYVHRPHARLHTCQNVTFTAAVITNTSQAARSIRDTHQSVGCWLMARRVHESMSCTSSTIYIAEGTGLSKCTKENILSPTCMPLQDEVYASSSGGSSNRTK